MARRRSWGRPLDGVLLLNKSTGMTSNDALQQAKRLFFAQKAGHTGSLDPLATGVLPICFGEATKFSQYLLDADKRYSSTFRLGVKTETGDCDGEIVARCDSSHLDRSQVEDAIVPFRGEISQVPSMYSALKYQGKPLYKWAREGIEVPRDARDVTIFHYEVTGFRPGIEPEVDVEIHCSKGTYVRSLAEDLGEVLGVGAHVIRLHRRSAGPFDELKSISLEQLTDERGEQRAEILDYHLLPMDAPASQLPQIAITDDSGFYFSRGQAVMEMKVYRLAAEGDMVRVCLNNGDFLGVGEVIDDGQIAPKRLVNQH